MVFTIHYCFTTHSTALIGAARNHNCLSYNEKEAAKENSRTLVIYFVVLLSHLYWCFVSDVLRVLSFVVCIVSKVIVDYHFFPYENYEHGLIRLFCTAAKACQQPTCQRLHVPCPIQYRKAHVNLSTVIHITGDSS